MRWQDNSVQREDGCNRLLEIRLGFVNATKPANMYMFHIRFVVTFGFLANATPCMAKAYATAQRGKLSVQRITRIDQYSTL